MFRVFFFFHFVGLVWFVFCRITNFVACDWKNWKQNLKLYPLDLVNLISALTNIELSCLIRFICTFMLYLYLTTFFDKSILCTLISWTNTRISKLNIIYINRIPTLFALIIQFIQIISFFFFFVLQPTLITTIRSKHQTLV